MSDQDGMEVLQDERLEDLTVAGVRLEIRPLIAVQFPGFTRALRPVLGTLRELAAQAMGKPRERLMFELPLENLVADHGEAIIQAVAIATKQKLEWVQARELDELLQLAGTVLRVNLDFFMRRLVPMFTTQLDLTMAKMGAIQKAAGHEQSSGSSATGTDGLTS
jgi:uncharacterized protein DUF6631